MLRPFNFKRWIFVILILMAILGVATPVLADYIGPNRVVTQPGGSCQVVLNECQYVASKDDYRYHQVKNWSCSNENKPWQAYPSEAPRDCVASTVGDRYWSREEGQPETVVYPPATIAGSLENCSLQNGWCVSPPQLSLYGNEPVPGYNILALEGTLNGQTFACSSSSCSVPLVEGDNNFTFWALSSWGDSSSMGTATARVDITSPNVGLEINGSSGSNGWYVSPVNLIATGSDAISGLAGTFLSVNNGSWQSSATLNDGVYAIAVNASDNAGNTSSSSTTISIDTTTPYINVSINGTAGKNGWYRSNLQISAFASDATSGIDALEVSTDGGPYQSYADPISFSEGQHTIQFKATDRAGNITEIPAQVFYVDTIPPEIKLPLSWQMGKKIPYIVQDAGSGLNALRLVIEDEDERYAKVAWNENVSGINFSRDINWSGEFKDGTVAPEGTYLVWLKASDKAGNEQITLGKIIVPEKNVLISLLPADNSVAETPAPPEDLTEAKDIPLATTPPTLAFGGSATNSVMEPETHSVFLTTGTAATIPSGSSNVLWGAAAAAMAGAVTTFVLSEKRKREETLAEQIAQEVQEQERREKNQARKLEKLETQWAQEEAWKEAREAYSAHIDMKIARTELEEGATWMAPKPLPITHADRKIAEAELEEGATWMAPKPPPVTVADRKIARADLEEGTAWMDSQAAIAERNREKKESEESKAIWWEKTKDFFTPAAELAVDFHAWGMKHIYEPFEKPLINKTIELIKKEAQWENETFREPYIKPFWRGVGQAASSAIDWLNTTIYQPYLQNIYQPHIAPIFDKVATGVTKGLTWSNENIYQPYLSATVERAKERTKESIASEFATIREYIYKPIIRPVASDINQYIYQPYVKPVLDPVFTILQNAWDEYGEWVHTALDVVGVIPGIGDWADGVNAVIYLAEGRYLEAGISAMSMIPIIGDLAKSGKAGLKLGAKAVEEVGGKVLKEGVEAAIEMTEKQVAELASEKALKGIEEGILTNVVEKSAQETVQKATQEAGEALADQAIKESTQEGAKVLAKETGKDVAEKTAATISKKTLDKLGQIGLDGLGLLPGFSEITSSITTAIHLANRSFFDATVSAMSMVPIVGSYAVGALNTLKVTKELGGKVIKEISKDLTNLLSKEIRQEVSEQTLKETGEMIAEKATAEILEESIETGVKEVSEEALEKATKEVVEEGFEKGLKETSQEVAEKATKGVEEQVEEKVSQAVAEKTTKEAAEETASTTTKETAEKVPLKPNNKVSDRLAQDAIQDKLAENNQERVKSIDALREKHGDAAVDKFLSFCNKYDIDPHEVLARPPVEGQSLIGWGLGIKDPSNPVNHPLVELNLTRDEINNIIEKSVVRSNSKIVVLGYGGGVEKPYYKLSDEIEGCHLSLSAEDWAPFENARSNFWTEINAPFIERAIDERKIFLFNVNEKVIDNPRNIERFSLPELRIIELESNNYVKVPIGDYMACVPIELASTYKQYLPAGLIK